MKFLGLFKKENKIKFSGGRRDVFDNLKQLDFNIVFRRFTNTDFIHSYASIHPLATAIDFIKDKIQCVDLEVRDITDNSIATDHPVLELLKNPNPFYGYNEFIEKIVISFLVTGNFYLQLNALSGNLPPLELFSESPENVRFQENIQDGYIQEYNVFNNNATSITYDRIILNKKAHYFSMGTAKELYHAKLASPLNRQWKTSGYSILNACMYEIALYRVGLLFNLAVLDNQGAPAAILTPKVTLSEKQQGEMAKQLRSISEGPQNAGRMLILPQDINYTQISMTAKDMQYSELNKTVQESIYNRFNIPLASVQSNSLSLANLAASETLLYTDAVLPRLERITDELTRALMPRYDNSENLKITFDTRTIPALATQRFDNLKTLKSLNVLTTNEIRDDINREPLESGGDDVLVPVNVAPIGEAPNNNDFEDDPDGDTGSEE